MKTSDFVSMLIHNSKTAEPINDKSDYTRVKKWVKKATKLYVAFSIISIVISLLFSTGSKMLSSFISGGDATYGAMVDVMSVPFTIVVLLTGILTAWGLATMILNFKVIIKSIWSSGKAGYHAGEQIQTEHVTVRHEYGDRYKVSTYTEDQGCVMALIYGFINLFVWAFLCVYVCSFLTLKKISDSKKNLKNFKTV